MKYAASASEALLSMQPIVFRQMRDQIEKAEKEATEEARLRAYHALREIVMWLAGAS